MFEGGAGAPLILQRVPAWGVGSSKPPRAHRVAESKKPKEPKEPERRGEANGAARDVGHSRRRVQVIHMKVNVKLKVCVTQTVSVVCLFSIVFY